VFGKAGNVAGVNDVVAAVSGEDERQHVLERAIDGLITARDVEAALELSAKVMNDGARAQLLSRIANAMSAEEAHPPPELLHTALLAARGRGRQTVFRVLENALSIVAGVGGARALAELHKVLVEIDSWWVLPTDGVLAQIAAENVDTRSTVDGAAWDERSNGV